MIVDDDEDFVAMNQALLEANGYEVVAAYTGHEALSKVATVRPDVIVLDIMMETWSQGMDVADKLRRQPGTRGTPILVVSSLNLRSPFRDMVPAEDALKADAYIVKPVLPGKLLQTIGELAAKRRDGTQREER
jgi:CheY-like chemotaxis protein